MGYININGQASVFVQTGMKNASQAASAQLLSKTLGGVNTGYINNGTEGLVGDVGEYLPNSVSKKDVLNEPRFSISFSFLMETIRVSY